VSDSVLIVELPVIPRVSVLPDRVFPRVVLAWFIHCAGRPKGLENSQRQICSRFNRSNREIIGNYLKEAREANFLKLLTASDGLNPDVHVRGAFFDDRTRDRDRFIQLANSLWGSQKGLLSQWPYPSAWGHGCTPPAVILCLATLNVLDEPIQRKALREYLEPLVPESSFNDAVRWMKGRDLIVLDACGLTASKDWQEKFVRHLFTSLAGSNRQERGDRRRKRESDTNRSRVKKATITRSEQDALKRLPCVKRGCKKLGTEMEHFPPRRFLRHLADQTNKHLVWSICEEHNDETQSFIKCLPGIPADISSQLFIDARCSKWDVYEAVSNFDIQRFYSAAHRRDGQGGNFAISNSLALLNAILQSGEIETKGSSKRKETCREKIGVRAYRPDLSKL
jgi:hypothetical protein